MTSAAKQGVSMYAPRNASELDSAVLSEFQYLSSKLKAWAAVGHNEDGSHRVVSATANRVVGEGAIWFTNTAPPKWLLCDGSQVSRTTYQSLFEIIGTTYGAGDGSTTFTLPDFRQRFPLGKASSGTGATIAATGGSIDHTHSFSGGTTGSNGGFTANTSSNGGHDHGGATGINGTPTVAVASGVDYIVPVDPHTHPISSASDHNHSVTVSDHTHTFGSGTTGTGNPPFLAIHFIVYAGV